MGRADRSLHRVRVGAAQAVASAGFGGRAAAPPPQASERALGKRLQRPYILLRQVDDRPRGSGGSGEAGLSHSVPPWFALEEKARVQHLDCLRGSLDGTHTPTEYEEVPGAGALRAPHPSRAGSKPGPLTGGVCPKSPRPRRWQGAGTAPRPGHAPALPGDPEPQLTFSPWVPFSPLGPCRDEKETGQNLTSLLETPEPQHGL